MHYSGETGWGVEEEDTQGKEAYADNARVSEIHISLVGLILHSFMASHNLFIWTQSETGAPKCVLLVFIKTSAHFM